MAVDRSLYQTFSTADWRQYRRDTPMTLDQEDLSKLQGLIESVSLREIEEVYLPLSRLLGLYVSASQELQSVSMRFLDRDIARVPYIIGVAGSVSVGKSTTSRVLQALLSRWPDHPNVEIITTDAFLYPTAELERRDLMARKGFPESYDIEYLLQTLVAIKSGETNIRLPVYSHYHYDILPNESRILSCPDIVIVEGLNILQHIPLKPTIIPRSFIADLLDFSIFVDAEVDCIEQWFVERFSQLRLAAKNDPDAFFYQFVSLSEQEALDRAMKYWKDINQVNLLENILPFKWRADLILHKVLNHSVDQIMLRRL